MSSHLFLSENPNLKEKIHKKTMVSMLCILNVGTTLPLLCILKGIVPMLCILNVGTIPMMCILNAGTSHAQLFPFFIVPFCESLPLIILLGLFETKLIMNQSTYLVSGISLWNTNTIQFRFLE